MKKLEEVIIGMGSNIGDRMGFLNLAILELEKVFDCQVKCSPIYETEAWGFTTENQFLNCCVIIKTNLSPEEVLTRTQNIELKLGRIKKNKKNKKNNYDSRVIDLDVLYYGSLIFNSDNLTIPHPLLYDRSFVIRPLSDICPDLVDPVKRTSIFKILAACNDKSKILLYEE